MFVLEQVIIMESPVCGCPWQTGSTTNKEIGGYVVHVLRILTLIRMAQYEIDLVVFRLG
jgi:hypothetical protein